MKVLYAIQGTGNGHLSRAYDVVPILDKKVDLEVMISGIQADLQTPFDIKYNYRGMSFIFGKKGGVDIWKTYENTDVRQLWKEINNLPVQDYDLVINDFEMVSARAAQMKNVPCISLSHQSAVLNENAPQPKDNDWLGIYILKHYAPVEKSYGFHFEEYAENIFTPVIRKEIRNLSPVNKGHYTVYLPAYGDEVLIKRLTKFRNVKWEVFSKHSKEKYRKKNVRIFPINNQAFIESMATSEGVLCGAGFETPAEALFLGKKLMVIPMKTQYEQQCNAAALKQLGVPVLKNLKENKLPKIESWIKSEEIVNVDYPDHLESVIDKVLNDFSHLAKTTKISEKKNDVVY